MTDLDQSPALPYDLIAEGPTEGWKKDYSGGSGGGIPGGINTQVQFNNSGTFGGLTDVQLTARIDAFTSVLSGAVPASGGGTVNFLRADGTFATPPGGSATPGGSNGQVQFNNSGVFGGLADSQITARINAFTSVLSGAVPASGGGTTNFLRADGTFAVPPGIGGLADGDKGDITVSGSGTVWTVDAGAITYSKIQNVTNTSRFLGRITAGAGVTEELTGTQATTLLDVFTDTLKGLVPASSGGTTSFLRADGTFAVPPSGGAGTPGGADTQIQYNAAGAFAGDNGLSYAVGSTTVTLGLNATKTGKLAFANGGGGGASVTVQNPSATVAYNFNLPINAGAAGQLMQSGGGGATPMAWTATPTLGTNASVTGQIILANGGGGGASVTVQNNSATSPYNFNLPIGPGVAGQLIQSQGGGSSPMVWSYSPALGANGSVTGQLLLANGNASGATVTVQNRTATAAYNFNLPGDAGQAGQILQSQGGGTSPMVWTATPSLGITGVATGSLAFRGLTSGVVTLSVGNAAGTWNMKLPTTAGTPNQVLQTDGSGNTVWATPASGGITGPGSTVQGAPLIWATTGGGSVVDGKGYVNALAYGADPTGVANSVGAIQTALNTGHKVFLPRGTYSIGTTLTIPAGGGIIGEGMGFTVISCSFAAGDAILVPANTNYVELRNLTVTRSVAPSSGYGINFNSVGVAQNNGSCVVDTVTLQQHAIGIHLGSTAWGYVNRLFVSDCTSHGVLIDGSPGQWQINTVFSGFNGGDGFHCSPTSGTSVPAGNWSGLASNNNSGKGFSSTNYAAIRLSNCFFGGDQGDEVYLGTGGSTGYAHQLTHIYTEFSFTGYGFMFDTGMVESVCMNNCIAVAHFRSGVINNTGRNVMINGGNFDNNGQGGQVGNTYGVLNFAANSTMSVMGVRAPASGFQTVGVVSVAGTTACTVVGSNTTTSLSATTTYTAGNY